MIGIATLAELLAAKPLVDRPLFGDTNAGLGVATLLSSSKEKEYQVKLQHLTELLNESEANHQRLLEQEKVGYNVEKSRKSLGATALCETTCRGSETLSISCTFLGSQGRDS